jgi:hypothetical protein
MRLECLPGHPAVAYLFLVRSMDIERLLQSRALRKTRGGRPFKTFFRMYSEVLEVQQADTSKIAPKLCWVLEKQSVITMITATEVYFRDILDGIFRVCKPEAFRPVLKEIYKSKHDIDDLLQFHVNRVHPLALVADSFNFQNPAVIASVFDKLIRKPLWKSVIGMSFRIKDKPESQFSLDADHLLAFERSLRLRHELIHNPDASRRKLSKDNWSDLHSIAGLIFGCDVVINNFISENLDDEVKQSIEKT